MAKMKLIVLCFLLFWGNVLTAQKTNTASKPNIVFILADDLGYGDLEAYGQKIIKTPRISELADEGMQFSNFYAGTSVCAPSRSSLMTGQHTGHTYIRGNKEIEPEGQEPLAASVVTFAQLLQNSGYTTGAFGKWGLGMVGTTGDPNKKGFDQFFGYNCQRQSHSYYPDHLWNNSERIELTGNTNSSRLYYAPELIQQKTLSFIRNNKDKPFFLFVPTVLPHAGLQGPEDQYYKMYENLFPEKPFKGAGNYAPVDKPRATFAAMVSRMDGYVGQMMDLLDSLGLEKNTLIVFCSDNGAHTEGGADPAFFNSNGNLRGLKRDLYEGGIKVPFIVRWPGKIQPGSRCDYIGAFWDVMPTLMEVAGVRKKLNIDGISFLASLLSRKQAQTHKYLYWEFHEGGGRQAVRMGKWKGVRLNVSKNPAGLIELYNLDEDPYEKENIAGKYPSVVAQMDKYMHEAHQPSVLFPF